MKIMGFKNSKASLCILMIINITMLFSQENVLEEYRRSSLSIVLIDTDNYPSKGVIVDAFRKFIQEDFPDKYNNFQIPGSVLDPKSIETSEEIKKVVYEKRKTTEEKFKATLATMKGFLKDQAILNINAEINFEKIIPYFENTKYANELIQKWYPYNSKSKSSEEFVIDSLAAWGSDIINIRSAIDEIGGSDGFKANVITNAAKDLIPNTYVIVYNLQFIENELVAKVIKDEAYKIVETLDPLLQKIAKKVADKIYEKAKIGYTVLAYAYLYQLDFDEDKLIEFYTNDYRRESREMKTKFKLKWIGSEVASAIVTFSLKKEDKGRTKDDILFRATRRTIDRVFSKLQKKYDQFKPIFPLASVDPFSAYVGLKEGINNRSKFEVYSSQIDKKTGERILKVVGELKAVKNEIWDNRFDFIDIVNRKNNAGRTLLKGKVKNAIPGLLVKQIK